MNFDRKLVLADGTVFLGNRLGLGDEVIREVVFQTAKAGYQDVLMDPDNYNQVVVMPHSMVNSDGINPNDPDASQGASALIVDKYCASLDRFLKDKNISGLCDVDTGALINKIRADGVMYGIIVDVEVSDEQALVRLTSTPYVTNHVKQVSPKKPYQVSAENKKFRVALIAFTAKKGIINELTVRGCEVIVLPYNTSVEEIKAFEPDGVMLSSGPGDPLDLPELLPVISALQKKYPLFGICLGHQLFAIANGAKTSQMKFGHRGEDIQVKDIGMGKILTTFQNHGYHVDADSLAGTDLEITQYAVDDGSIEGLKHKKYPAFTVQYHPEAHTDTRDSNYLFDRFVEMLGL
ncbi:MAG: carbamoyl phosphate synthase small subunit [Oscillospiraceae bacterium]|nr:carbamoyl phosphate synthase small subunit [Oscillospiraceae bacterium]